MDFFSRIKSYLGFQSNDSGRDGAQHRFSPRDAVRDESQGRQSHREHPPDEFDRFGFNVFSSPLEMHRYFEHQMNEMMKSFGMFDNHDSLFGNSFFGPSGDPFFGSGGNPFLEDSFRNDAFHFPAIEDFHGYQQQPGNLRDQYLKPGYEQEQSNEAHKSDKDLDGKFDIGDLDAVLKGKPSQPRTYFYGQSVTSKTVRNPDGSIETHKTVKDQQGNEETTVMHKYGDKEYSITTRTDRDGQKEVIENLVNIDEEEKDEFIRGRRPKNQITSGPEERSPNWFPFDKFFK